VVSTTSFCDNNLTVSVVHVHFSFQRSRSPESETVIQRAHKYFAPLLTGSELLRTVLSASRTTRCGSGNLVMEKTKVP